MSLAVADGTRLGPYEVVALIGRGGMGEVYRARDPRLGREVAVKVLPAEVAHDARRLARFEREARAVAALNHPNVLTVYDVGNIDGIAYLVTELLQGQTLREWLLTGALPAQQALGWALEIVRGLEAAHARGIVHRDLKPSNVFVTADGRVKILDFGLAQPALRGGARAPSSSTTSDVSPAGTVAGTLAYMSPEQLRGVALDGRSDLFSFGVVLYEMLGGTSPFGRESAADVVSAILNDPVPLLSERAPVARGPLERIVERCLEKRAEDRFASAHDLGLALEALMERPSGTALSQLLREPNPYPGLASFTERDADAFFGREREVAALWERLQTQRLLAVIGPSGAGKTSFVRAGVVASCPPGWAAAVCTPGRSPLRALAQALVPEFAGDPGALRHLFAVEEPSDLVEVAARWKSAHQEALLVLDQFEELFTLSRPETRGEIAGLLGRLAADTQIHVLLVLRDDFLIRTQEHPALRPVLGELTALLPVSGEDLRRAVVEPARKHGYRFDDGLVDELAGAVEGERGALPLLAFALARLWEERDRGERRLTRAAYAAIGGVEGALARHAEATLAQIGSEHHGLVREIFRNLVTAQGTRAVVDREELLTAFPDEKAAQHVLGRLVDARLLTAYEPKGAESPRAHHRIEIVHESLLRSWPRLVRWQTQDADGAVLRDQLRQAAHLWEEKGRTPDLLWSGTAYRDFELWRERYPGTLTELEQDYARAMVDSTRRRKRLRRTAVTAAFLVLATVAVAVGVARRQAVQQAERADREALSAEASKLLALAQSRLEGDPTEALAFATASLELADNTRARLMAMRALWEAPPALELPHGLGLGGRVPTFDPTGEWLAVTGHMGAAGVWARDGRRVALLEGHEARTTTNSAGWATRGRIVTGLRRAAKQLHVWSLPDGQELRTLELGGESRWQTAGDRVLTATREALSPGDGDVEVLRAWDLTTGLATPLGTVAQAPQSAVPGRFAPDGSGWMSAEGSSVRWRSLPAAAGDRGRLLSRHPTQVVALEPSPGNAAPVYSRDEDGGLRVYAPASGAPEAQVITRPATAPPATAPDPGGRWLAAAAVVEARAHLWDRSSWLAARPLALRRNLRWYGAGLAFHPSGDWLVASTDNFVNLTFWPLKRPYPVVVDGPPMRAMPYRLAAFTPDSRWLVVSPGDGRIQLWPLNEGSRAERVLAASTELWTALDIAPDGRSVVAASAGGSVVIVSLATSEVRRLEGFQSDTVLYDVAFSPSGRQVASAFSFGTGERSLRVWDPTGKARVWPLPPYRAPSGAGSSTGDGYAGAILDVAFLDEDTLLTAGDGGVRCWDLRTGQNRLVLGQPGQDALLFLSADRRIAVTQSVGDIARENACYPPALLDIQRGSQESLPEFGACAAQEAIALDPTGRIMATGDREGVIRVGLLEDRKPHVLMGHEGTVNCVAISPDLRWIASMGEDNTLRLWPMPDLDAPPLHTLPRDELIAKLKSLTNLRAVRDPEAPDGWRIDLAPFPGWKEVPTW